MCNRKVWVFWKNGTTRCKVLFPMRNAVEELVRLMSEFKRWLVDNTIRIGR